MTERQVLDAHTPRQWEQWLERNHDAANEIWLRLLNKNAAEPGMSYGEAVEIALCFGWIDSLARRYDDVSRIQRFSPRKSRSAWSNPTSNGCNASSRPGACGKPASAKSTPPRQTAGGRRPSQYADTRSARLRATV
jgi:hypothetical protein